MKNSRDVSPIDDAAIYDVTMELCSSRESRNWHARLRRRGFKRSVAGEAYYHPKHWRSIGFGLKNDAGDFWIMNDAFKALTKKAKEWLKNCE